MKQILNKVDYSITDKIGQFAAIAFAFSIPISTAATTILIGILLICWLLGPNQAQKWHLAIRHPLMKWIYPLVIIALLGATYSVGDPKSLRHGVFDGLRLLSIPILIYFYQSKKIATLALWAFAAAMILTLVLAYLKIYAGLPVGLKYTTGAIFKSHIKTSYFMAIAAFFLALQAKEMIRYRMVLAVLIVAMVYYLFFMSVGRIGYIALVVCLLVTAWQWYRLKGVLTACFLALLFLMGAYSSSSIFSDRINLLAKDLDFYHQGGDLIHSSLGSRLEFATSSISLLAKRPWLGWGTGSYGVVYAQLHEGEETLFTDNPHNEYLRMGVEFGMLGMTLLLLLFYQQWRYSGRLANADRSLWQGILFTFILGCFINSWLKDFTEAYFFCLMTAICFAKLTMPFRRSDFSSNARGSV